MSEELIKTTKKLYKEPTKQLELGKAMGGIIDIQQASEKALNTVLQLIDGFIEKMGMERPKDYHDRDKKLREIVHDKEEPNIWTRFLVIQDCLEDYRLLNLDYLESIFKKVGEYIGEIESWKE